MSVNFTLPDELSHHKVREALDFTEGLVSIINDIPGASATLLVGERVIGYRLNFSVAGRKKYEQELFWCAYAKQGESESERTRQETGARLLPVLTRMMLHQQSMKQKTVPASDIKVPTILRAILDQAGVSGAEFLKAIGNKTTSWNDGAPGAGRKIARLPLPVMTAGEFRGDTIEMTAIKAPSGADVQFIHSGRTPVYYFEGVLPTIISDPLLGRPLTEMAEAPEFEPIKDYLVIKGFDYPKYGANYAQMESVQTTVLGDPEPHLSDLRQSAKDKLEHWLGVPIDEPKQELAT